MDNYIDKTIWTIASQIDNIKGTIIMAICLGTEGHKKKEEKKVDINNRNKWLLFKL